MRHPLSWYPHLNVFQAQLFIAIKSIRLVTQRRIIDCFSTEIKSPCPWRLKLSCLVICDRMSNHYLWIHDQHLLWLFFRNWDKHILTIEFKNKLTYTYHNLKVNNLVGVFHKKDSHNPMSLGYTHSWWDEQQLWTCLRPLHEK